nr:glycosyltransferase family 39 protein [uncultured Fluviicola sp.]
MINRSNYTNYYLPIFFILLGFVVKGLFLGFNSLGGDEPFSVYHSQLSLDHIFGIFQSENNPPLHFLLLHYWIKFFGISEFSVRMPSLIFSAFTVLFIYRIGLRFFNLRVAVIASILFTFSTYQVLYAHEARAYALMGFLTAVSMFYYLEIVHSKNRNNWKIFWFLLANALLIYTHFFGFFILFIQFFFILFQRKLLKAYYRFLILFVGVMLITYSPYLWLILNRFSSASGGTWVSPPSGINALYEMLRAFSNTPVTAVFTLTGMLVGLVILIIKRRQNPNRIATRLVLCWFYIPFLFMFVISFWIPMFLDRYLMFISIGFPLMVAISTNFIIQNPKFRIIIPALICMLFIVTIKPNKTNKREVRETVQLVKQLENDQTLVLVAPVHFSLNFIYYYDQELFKYSDIELAKKKLNERRLYCINSLEGIDYKSAKRIVLVDAASNFSAPNNNILNTLNAEFNQVNKHHIEEIFDIYEFTSK